MGKDITELPAVMREDLDGSHYTKRVPLSRRRVYRLTRTMTMQEISAAMGGVPVYGDLIEVEDPEYKIILNGTPCRADVRGAWITPVLPDTRTAKQRLEEELLAQGVRPEVVAALAPVIDDRLAEKVV